MMMNNNGFDYVDLGLSSGTLWATCNVGATSPTEYGKYFAWGDTDGYYDNEEHDFSWNTYKYSNDRGTKMTKYNNEDELTELEFSDDAVHVNMGGDWKMPTRVQMDELFNETNNEFVDDYQGSGINGRVFTSKSDSRKSIFIPASGHCGHTSVRSQGINTVLWSSTLRAHSNTNSFCGGFLPDYVFVDYYARYYGFCVRGVINKTDNIKSDE